MNLDRKLRNVGSYSLLNFHGRVFVLKIELKAEAPGLATMESAMAGLVLLIFQLGEDLRQPNAQGILFSVVVANKAIKDGDARLRPLLDCLQERFQAVVQFEEERAGSFRFSVHSGLGGVSLTATNEHVAEALGVDFEEVLSAISELLAD